MSTTIEQSRMSKVMQSVWSLISKATGRLAVSSRKFAALRQVDLEMRRLQSQKMDRLIEMGRKTYELYQTKEINQADLVKVAATIEQLDASIQLKEREMEAIRVQKDQ